MTICEDCVHYDYDEEYDAYICEQDLDEDEFLDIHTIPLSELVEDVMAGKISDAKTQVCILKAARILGL